MNGHCEEHIMPAEGLDAKIMAPERIAARRLDVRRVLDGRPQPWIGLGVRVFEYANHRVITVESRGELQMRIGLAMAAATADESTQLQQILASMLAEPSAVPVVVIGAGQLALELGEPEYFAPGEALP